MLGKKSIFLFFFFLIGQIGAFPLEREDKSKCIYKFPSDSQVEWFCYKIKAGETLESLFGTYWESILRFNRIDRRRFNPGGHIKVPELINGVVNFTPFPLRISDPDIQEIPKYAILKLEEQFVGCYEFGKLIYSFPITPGKRGFGTPRGKFTVKEFHKRWRSTRYNIAGTNIPYPMYWGIRFHGPFWIHSRDMPGYAASHGCVGLYDENMQKRFYGFPQNPVLNDAEKFFKWLFPESPEDEIYKSFGQGAPGILIEVK